MKYGKILTAFMLALAMCLGLTACGGDNGGDSNDNNDSIQTPPPVIEEYDQLYFFNEHDGCAYLARGGAAELAIESLGTYTISGSGSNGADEAFADIADVWYLDGEKDGLSCIVILSDGQWGLGERTQAGEDFVTVDRGQLEQDPDDADQYYARSSAFDDVTYDMHTTAEKDLFWWGGENDTYLRQADSQ